MFKNNILCKLKNIYFLHLISDSGKFRFWFSVFGFRFLAKTKKLNDTETETEMQIETEILAETDTKTESFRSLVTIRGRHVWSDLETLLRYSTNL